MNTIGIDFGTSFCTASWINPTTSKPEAITFYTTGKQKIPSVVYYSKENVIVGEPAYAQFENSYSMINDQERNEIMSSVIQNIKRDMQKGKKNYLPGGRCITDEEIIADILRHIKQEVEKSCFNNGETVEKAIITHPVIFHNWQKEMLINASKLASFNSVELLEEPVAAAVGYASTTSNIGKGILVYDFGGGTFDVAFVLRNDDGTFRVPVQPEGDSFCGGNDIDMVIYDIWEREAKIKLNRNISSTPERVDIGFIARCRRQKETLSMMESHRSTELLPLPNLDRLEMTIYRKDFEKQIDPIIDKTIQKTQLLIKRVKDAGYDIDTAIMIGGSSRIPIVYEKLNAILSIEPRRVMQVDVAVALGAILNGKITNDYSASIEKKDIDLNVKKVYCIYCGFSIVINDKFCGKCGKPNFKNNK